MSFVFVEGPGGKEEDVTVWMQPFETGQLLVSFNRGEYRFVSLSSTIEDIVEAFQKEPVATQHFAPGNGVHVFIWQERYSSGTKYCLLFKQDDGRTHMITMKYEAMKEFVQLLSTVAKKASDDLYHSIRT